MKYNLIFEGLNETEGENTETVIKEFIKTELKIENEISFQNVHRLHKSKDRTPREIGPMRCHNYTSFRWFLVDV
jgi:hypothetical protein